MYHDLTPYHRFHTYTFDGMQGMHQTCGIDTISQLKQNRPMIADGIMKLYKEDIKVYYDDGRCQRQRQLRVQHPYTNGKTGFVVFSFHDIPNSQDTKTTYTAFVIFENGIKRCPAILKTCKTPWIMYMRSDGFLTEYKGPVDVLSFGKFLGVSNL